MKLTELWANKDLKPKEITETLSQLLIEKKITIDSLIEFATTSKDPVKGTCIEALEYLTQQNPDLLTQSGFDFVTQQLTSKAPRVKWESAKVVGNSCKLFNANLDQVIENLLTNSQHEGTVVRWSAAYALGEILKLKTDHNLKLIPQVETIIGSEEKNSIVKIYQSAIKKILKN